MRKALLSLGIVILFVGVIIFSVSNQHMSALESNRVEGSRAEKLPYGEWKTSVLLGKDERIFVTFGGPNLVGVPNGGDIVTGTMWINITDPEGGNTTFKLEFKDPDFPQLNLTIETRSDGLVVDDSALGDFNDSPEDLGGITVGEGNYTATAYTWGLVMAKYYYPDEGVLPYIEFWILVEQIDYPNSGFLPVGAILIIAGVSLSVWASRSSESSSKRRSKR